MDDQNFAVRAFQLTAFVEHIRSCTAQISRLGTTTAYDCRAAQCSGSTCFRLFIGTCTYPWLGGSTARFFPSVSQVVGGNLWSLNVLMPPWFFCTKTAIECVNITELN